MLGISLRAAGSIGANARGNAGNGHDALLSWRNVDQKPAIRLPRIGRKRDFFGGSEILQTARQAGAENKSLNLPLIWILAPYPRQIVDRNCQNRGRRRTSGSPFSALHDSKINELVRLVNRCRRTAANQRRTLLIFYTVPCFSHARRGTRDPGDNSVTYVCKPPGPMRQRCIRPLSELSRGASVEDIVATAALVLAQA